MCRLILCNYYLLHIYLEYYAATIFSFASVFLFLAVLPLIYAPETLPEKLMKDRDLKSYVEKAKKKAQKESGKVNKKDKTENILSTMKKPARAPDEQRNMKMPRNLAEKYY